MRHVWTHPVARAAGGGVLFALGSPPTDAYPAILVGLAVLAHALQGAPTAGRAALRAGVWATSAGLVGLRFVPGVVERFTALGWAGGVAALVLLSAVQALGWSAGAAAGHALVRTGTPRPIAFGAATFLAISVPTVFGWTPAGLLSPWPALIQLADTVGERGVSLLLAIAAALAAEPFAADRAEPDRWRRWAPLGGAGALLGALVGHGALRVRSLESTLATRETLRVGIVQAAVPARLRWEPGARGQILGWLRQLTVQSERRGAELTLWPEAAYPHVLPHAAGAAPRGSAAILGGGVRGPVLFGLLTDAAGGGRHNSATLLDRSGMLQSPQAKLQLLWFGETVPFADRVPALRRIFFRSGSLVPGDRVQLLEHRGAALGVLNCYEDTLPAVGRRIARERPALLVNVTNDAWFGATAEPELHLRLSALRAVEARLDLVRAVNLGVPAWIDATGTVRARGSAERRDVLVASPHLAEKRTSPTLYVKAGDVPTWSGLLVVAIVGAIRRRAARGREPTEPGPSGP